MSEYKRSQPGKTGRISVVTEQRTTEKRYWAENVSKNGSVSLTRDSLKNGVKAKRQNRGPPELTGLSNKTFVRLVPWELWEGQNEGSGVVKE